MSKPIDTSTIGHPKDAPTTTRRHQRTATGMFRHLFINFESDRLIYFI